MFNRCNNIFTIFLNAFVCIFIASYAMAGNIEVTSQGLAVNGTVTAKEIMVTDIGWADYVFEADYALMSLESIAEFIRKNNHLPGIPSETTVRENGMRISEALKLQMQKIEELTLHMIAMKSENDLLKERIAQLEHENKCIQMTD